MSHFNVDPPRRPDDPHQRWLHRTAEEFNEQMKRDDVEIERLAREVFMPMSDQRLGLEGAWALERLLDGNAWWDVQEDTGLDKSDCLRIIALRDVIRARFPRAPQGRGE